ncbi:ankyrin repeat domain-containing protein [bacterium]|nr:ankyrin repeat domain-containing protein [bacterium]
MRYFVWVTNQSSGDCFCLWDHPEGEGLDYTVVDKISRGDSLRNNFTNEATIRMRRTPKEERNLKDFISHASGLLIGSLDTKAVIEKICSESEVEFLPFVLLNDRKREVSRKYVIINPLCKCDVLHVDCLRPSRDNWIFDKKKLKSAPHIFRVKDKPEYCVVSEHLGRLFYEHQFGNIFLNEIELKDSTGTEILPAGEITRERKQDCESREEIRNLIRDGKWPRAVSVIEKGGFDLNQSVDRRTLLCWAALFNSIPVIQALLAAGADPTGFYCHRWNGSAPGCLNDAPYHVPISDAARAGHLEACRILIDAQAKIDERNHLAETPLILAASAGHLDVVVLLLDTGAEIDARGHSGTALSYVVDYVSDDPNFVQVFQLLLERGADPQVSSTFGASTIDKVLAELKKEIKKPIDQEPRRKNLINMAQTLAEHASLNEKQGILLRSMI